MEPKASQVTSNGIRASHGDLRQIAKAYYVAKQALLRQGYAEELDWQCSLSIGDLKEQEFLREAAWVILSSGMSETVIRSKFDDISRAFFDWTSAKVIATNARDCKERAFCHFGHSSKLDAIVDIACHVENAGFAAVVERVIDRGVDYLRQFAFLGPATSYHLAKNIGLPVAKPDRHLTRIASALGYQCVQQLCADIASATEETIPMIDIVLWRFSAEHPRYISRFSRSFLMSCRLSERVTTQSDQSLRSWSREKTGE
jgi:hypothetical protein